MNVFDTHAQIVRDYESYIRSFINISDPAIRARVDEELAHGKLWPEPLLQFNPAYELAGPVATVAESGLLHPALVDIFKGYSLYRHQVDAIRLGTRGEDFVVTSGTGSGKSLTYIASIFHSLLTRPRPEGVSAIIVYPMNALINSQTKEIEFYRDNYERTTGKKFPITFGQYTGQEREEARQRMREDPPQVLLTNYMMLELLLTRLQERRIRDAIYANARVLVFDELHTYRGRQGGDIAMLIRRIRALCRQEVTCIGTSATMVSVGSVASQREQTAEVATTVFGRRFRADQVIGETLTRSLEYSGSLPVRQVLAEAVTAGIDPNATEAVLRAHPVAVWLENRVALGEADGQLVRGRPMRVGEVVSALAEASGVAADACERCLTDLLLWISTVNQRVRDAGSRYTILPFKLHQFIAQTGSVYTTLAEGADRLITRSRGSTSRTTKRASPFSPTSLAGRAGTRSSAFRVWETGWSRASSGKTPTKSCRPRTGT